MQKYILVTGLPPHGAIQSYRCPVAAPVAICSGPVSHDKYSTVFVSACECERTHLETSGKIAKVERWLGRRKQQVDSHAWDDMSLEWSEHGLAGEWAKGRDLNGRKRRCLLAAHWLEKAGPFPISHRRHLLLLVKV
jgi:hypothetical protein